MTHQELTTKIEELEELVKSGSDYIETERQAREMLEMSEISANPLLYCKTLLVLSASLWRRGIGKDALPYAEQAFEIAKKLQYQNLEAKTLNNIGNVYIILPDFPRALEYYHQALAMHEEIGNKRGIATVTGNIGNVYKSLSDYPRALESYRQALVIDEEIKDKDGIAIVIGNIGIVYASLFDYPRALEYFRQTLAINEEFKDKDGIASATGNIGNIYAVLSDYPRALECYRQALAMYEQIGSKRGIALVTGNIGIVYKRLSDYPRALEHYRKSLEINEEINDKYGIALVTGNLGDVYFHLTDYPRAKEYLNKSLIISEEIDALDLQHEAHQNLSELYEKQEQWQEYAFHLKRYYELDKEIYNEETKKKAQLFDIERKEAEREKQLAVERAKAQATEELLHNTLPPSIADRLLAGERIADHHADVSVVFADIVDFTRLSQNITAEELVKGLDLLFTTFDDIAEKYGLEKIKTIGDCYMAIAGAPIANENHAEVAALMAVEMIEAASKFRAIATGEPIQLRIGLHSGAAVAGVIGRRKYAYDLWGDAVNTASRMESYGVAGRIHCSEGFIEKLGENGNFKSSLRGEIEIKGKGVMNTYFLEKL